MPRRVRNTGDGYQTSAKADAPGLRAGLAS
jgi:hypothetical protein